MAAVPFPPQPATVAVAAELLDALTRALVMSPDPTARAGVIGGWVHEMIAAVEGLHGDLAADHHDDPTRELASLRQLAFAADCHEQRMAPAAVPPTSSAA